MAMEYAEQIRREIEFHQIELEKLKIALEVILRMSGKAEKAAPAAPLFTVRKVSAPAAVPIAERVPGRKQLVGPDGMRINWRKMALGVLENATEPMKSAEIASILNAKNPRIFAALTYLCQNGQAVKSADGFYSLVKSSPGRAGGSPKTEAAETHADAPAVAA